VIDSVQRARIWALIRADVAACESGDSLPPWYGQPEDARLEAAWRKLVAVDVSDRTRHIDEVQADLVRARAECDVALAVRDGEWRDALDQPRPTWRRLIAEMRRIPIADLAQIAELDDTMGALARWALRSSNRTKSADVR
jgi:hypothetical protein